VSDGNVNDGHRCQGVPVGTARYMRMAETEAKNTHEHFSLINDLSERVWNDRSRLLAPYLGLSDVRQMSERASGAEVVLR